MNRKAALCIMFASFIILTEGNTVTLLPDGIAVVDSGKPLSLQCVYNGTNNPSTFNFYLNPDTRGLQIRISNCMIVSSVGYDTSLYNRSCGTNNVSLIILAVSLGQDGQKWECDVSFTAVLPIPPKASTTISVTVPKTTRTISTTNETKCELELGNGLGLGSGIPIVITIIVVVIFIYTGCKDAYFLGLAHGVGIGVTFQVGWIIIAILICTGNKCKLELGLGLGLGSGMPCVITIIIAVIFMFSSSLFKGIPKRVEIGKGILTGLLFASVIGIIVVYLMDDKLKSDQTSIPKRVEIGKGILTGLLFVSVIGIIVVYFMYDKLKSEQTSIEPDDKPQEPAVMISKTKNSGSSSAVSREQVSLQMENKGVKSGEEERPPTVHTRTQNKVEPNTNSKKTNDRQQPVPPANTGFEDTPTFRRLPQPPQNGEIKDRSLRGISATIDDTPDLASETPRPNRLRPLTPKQATVQKEDASEEPKKKRKKKRKKDQMNVENPEEENGETDLRVN